MRQLSRRLNPTLAPYMGCFIAVWGLIGLEPRLDPAEVGGALALQMLVGALIWQRERPGGRPGRDAIAVVGFLVSVALLRAGVGSTPGYSSLVLLPIVWAAARSRRTQLSWAVVGAALVVFAPIVLIGGDRYPASGFRTGALILVIGTIIGATVLTLVDRLRSSERHHRLLALNSTDLITRFALDGTLTYASPACVEMLGYEPREIVGRNIANLIHPDDRSAHAERESRVSSAEDMTTSEARLRHRDGRYLWCEATVRKVRDGDGTVTERQAAIRDIGDRKQLALVVERQRDEANAILAFNDALAQIATLVATGAEPNATYATVAEQVGRLFGAVIGGVVRFNEAAGIGEIVGGWSAEESAFAGQTIDLAGTSAAAQVYRTGAPVQTGGLNDEVAGAVGLHSDAAGAICSAIVVGGRIWGSVGAAFAAGTSIAPGAGERLERFAELVAVAIANAQTLATLAEQAATDPLTGLANHRTFHEVLRTETERASRHGRALSVALFDVDHFKRVNDTHGHLTGDDVLAAIAHRLAAGARTGDTIARTGGEEFAWLMPETTQDAAYLAAERARREIESTMFATVGRLTVSVGVCSNQHGIAALDLFGAADRALYSAKRTGRNVTVIHGQDTAQAQRA